MRSQIGIEFMFGVAIMMFIYVVTIGVYTNYAQTDLIESEIAQQVCFKVATGINSAIIGEEGFAINVSIPYRIYGNDYNTIIISNTSLITVDWGEGLFACSIVSQNITGKWIYPGKLSANNINNTVYITSLNTDKLNYLVGEIVLIEGSHYFADVTVVIKDGDGNIIAGYPKIVTITNNEFQDSWVSTSPGLYTVSGTDTSKQTLYSERLIEVS